MSPEKIFKHNNSHNNAFQAQSIKRNQLKNTLGFGLLNLCALIFLTIFLGILIYIFQRGFGHAFSWHYLFSAPHGGMHDTGGILYPLIGTLYVVIFGVLFAAPVGIAAGIYLSEYARPTSSVTKITRFSIQILAGIPSVIFGLFGLAFFVLFLGMGHSLLAGTLSVSIMILPFIITTTEEAVSSVPTTFREASLSLGATKAETIFKVILPTASAGIFTGIMLGIGRAISESAILILAAGGSITAMPRIFGLDYPALLPDSGRTLAVHLYYQATSYNDTSKAFATAVILVFLILILNSIIFIFFKKKSLKK